MEIKMIKVGYNNVLQDFMWEKKSLANVYVQLVNAKNAFANTNGNDYLTMYPAVKTLFFRYIEYIERSIDFNNNMDEGDYLPATLEEMKSCLDRLNIWFLTRFNGQWMSFMGFFIAAPYGFNQVVDMIRRTTRLKNCQILQDNTAVEPYFGEENNVKILFGFVNMEGAWKHQGINASTPLRSACSKKCTNDLRMWVCTRCGDTVAIITNPTGWKVLLCSCGSKKYNEDLFICYHTSHRLQKPNRKRSIHSPVLDTKKIKDTIFDEEIFLL